MAQMSRKQPDGLVGMRAIAFEPPSAQRVADRCQFDIAIGGTVKRSAHQLVLVGVSTSLERQLSGFKPVIFRNRAAASAGAANGGQKPGFRSNTNRPRV